MAGGPNSTFEGNEYVQLIRQCIPLIFLLTILKILIHFLTFEGDEDVTSPPTTAVGAGDNNTLSPVLSPTSDTEHTTGILL